MPKADDDLFKKQQEQLDNLNFYSRKMGEQIGFLQKMVFPLHNQVISLSKALSSLTEEVRSLKGKAQNSKLDKIQEDVKRIQEALEGRIIPTIEDIEYAKEQKKKWLSENR